VLQKTWVTFPACDVTLVKPYRWVSRSAPACPAASVSPPCRWGWWYRSH